MGKQVYIANNGCESARTDMSLFDMHFKSLGYKPTAEITQADVVVFGGCSFHENAYQESIGAIKSLDDKRKPGSTLIVSGCIVGIMPERIKHDVPEANYVLPLNDLPHLAKELGNESLAKVVPIFYDDDDAQTVHLKVENGCAGKCTYCVIPNGRGNLRSYSLDSLAEAAQNIINEKSGVTLDLVGEDVGAYGLDLRSGTNVSDLVRRLTKLDGDYKIKINVINPWYFLEGKNRDVRQDLIDTISDAVDRNKFVPHLGLSMQSGSDKVLHAMKRLYTSANYESIIDALRERIPRMTFGTDVVIGFPTETEDDFRQTYDLLSKIRHDYHGLWGYKDMPGAPSTLLNPKVPESIIKKRMEVLFGLIHHIEMPKKGVSSLNELRDLYANTDARFPMRTNARQLFGGETK